MLDREVRFLFADDVYLLAPMQKIPSEVRKRGIPDHTFILDNISSDDSSMRKLRIALGNIYGDTSTQRLRDRDVIAQLKRLMRSNTGAIVFAKRESLLLQNNNSRVVDWLEKAQKSGIDPYSFLNAARNSGRMDLYDENLVAAERYLEGLDGNYDSNFIAGSSALKALREIKLFDTKPFSHLLGRNGSASIEFITRWGMLGAFDRENGVSLGQRIERESKGK